MLSGNNWNYSTIVIISMYSKFPLRYIICSLEHYFTSIIIIILFINIYLQWEKDNYGQNSVILVVAIPSYYGRAMNR